MVPEGMRRKMILLLIIATPGIPEYLTGSSKVFLLFTDPLSFFLGLGFNIALYSTGALLIREFSIKYNKGWFSILLLGGAYGIMEEGISVHTFFQGAGGTPGVLAIYGRYVGVDWIWALNITFFHAVFSIGLPLLLLAVAYPQYSRTRLLGSKGTSLVFFLYLLDVLLLNIVLFQSKASAMPTALDYIFFTLLSLVLVAVAYRISPRVFQARGKPDSGRKRLFLLGMMAFPLYLVCSFLPSNPDGYARIPPLLDAGIMILASLLLLRAVVSIMPSEENRRHLFIFAIGLIVPLLAWAELVEIIGIAPLITIATVIAIILLLKLRSMVRYRITVPAVA